MKKILAIFALLSAMVGLIGTGTASAATAPPKATASQLAFARSVRNATYAHPITLGTFVADTGETAVVDTNTVKNIALVQAGKMQPMWHFSWGWVSGTIYFNRNETWWVSVAGFYGWSAAWLPPPFNFIIGGSIVFYSTYAQEVQHFGQCLSVNTYGMPLGYRNGWCY